MSFANCCKRRQLGKSLRHVALSPLPRVLFFLIAGSIASGCAVRVSPQLADTSPVTIRSGRALKVVVGGTQSSAALTHEVSILLSGLGVVKEQTLVNAAVGNL